MFSECFGSKKKKRPRVYVSGRSPGGRVDTLIAVEPLYIILPYFNYCRFDNRTRLFLEFIERYKGTKGIRLVVIEGAEANTGFQLPKSIEGVFLHLAYPVAHPIWIKENLINIAVNHLPSSWKYMAWVDADLTFQSASWVGDTVRALERAPIVQMFKMAHYLGPDGKEIIKTDTGFGYQYCESGREYNKASKYGHWHCGFAWACTRAAYEAMGGLIDFAILGSGDRHMSLAWIGRVDDGHPSQIHNDYKERLRAYQKKCARAGLTIGYVNGSILHHWHGSLADRQYQTRWEILVKQGYSPIKDITFDKNYGTIGLTVEGQRMVNLIRNYFQSRNEDGAPPKPVVSTFAS